jgi:hypothetical protein
MMRLSETHRFQHDFFHIAQLNEFAYIDLAPLPISTTAIGEY